MNLKRTLAATVLTTSLVATSVVGPARAAEAAPAPPAASTTTDVSTEPVPGGFRHAFLVEAPLAILESRTRWSTT